MHFFNPPVAMKLVEMVRTEKTSPEAFRGAWDFVLTGLRRTPVDVKDTPGFIVNRVMRAYYVQSLRALEKGLATVRTIDRSARDHGAPLGPFELMD
jgi:3-hydroxyacyl-CoA dehydrogenase